MKQSLFQDDKEKKENKNKKFVFILNYTEEHQVNIVLDLAS